MAYVYGHYKADTGELFYIGKGTGRRAWEKSDRNPYWRHTEAKHGFQVRILEDNLTEEEALDKEKQLIAEVGLDNLTNIRPGGDGYTSEESRRLQLRLWKDPEHKKKLSEGMKRRWANPEERERHIKICKEAWEKLTPDEKEARASLFKGERNGMYGRRHTPEAIEKMRKKRGPNPKLAGENSPAKRPEVRQKMSEAKKKTKPITCLDCGKTIDPQNFGKWHKGGRCLSRS